MCSHCNGGNYDEPEPEDVMDALAGHTQSEAAEGSGSDACLAPTVRVSSDQSIHEIGRYDNEPTVAEALRKREQLRKEIKSSQANSELLLGALIGNGDVRL